MYNVKQGRKTVHGAGSAKKRKKGKTKGEKDKDQAQIMTKRRLREVNNDVLKYLPLCSVWYLDSVLCPVVLHGQHLQVGVETVTFLQDIRQIHSQHSQPVSIQFKLRVNNITIIQYCGSGRIRIIQPDSDPDPHRDGENGSGQHKRQPK